MFHEMVYQLAGKIQGEKIAAYDQHRQNENSTFQITRHMTESLPKFIVHISDYFYLNFIYVVGSLSLSDKFIIIGSIFLCIVCIFAYFLECPLPTKDFLFASNLHPIFLFLVGFTIVDISVILPLYFGLYLMKTNPIIVTVIASMIIFFNIHKRFLTS